MSNNFKLITKFPIAKDSPDHTRPLGTRLDSSRSNRYLQKCEEWLSQHDKQSGVILDLGCAGGGCVEDFVNKGYDAYGLEGSNYSQKRKRSAWRTIPDRLFTCDVSRPFTIMRGEEILKFDIIQSFEVMEHIKRKRLKFFFKNIHKHMKDDGIFIGSFSTRKGGWKYHQTVMNKDKWMQYIEQLGIFEFVQLEWEWNDYLRKSENKALCIPVVLRKLHKS